MSPLPDEQRLSEQLRQATRELEERQAQLIQVEKLASLGQMAAGIAHEVSSPASYVMSNLSTLSRYVSALLPLLHFQRELLVSRELAADPSREEQLIRMRELWQEEDVDAILVDAPELLQESLWGAQRIKEIVQSLRLFTREDSGEPQLADLNTELESTLKMVGSELKYKCEVRRDFEPLPLVRCHPTQLAQVFTNLLLNAAQACKPRGGAIECAVCATDSATRIEVIDTGAGMSPESLQRAFEPFFTTRTRGTGLGLSICRRVVEAHGGMISIESRLGSGTRVAIELPTNG
jgi:signal transduction histidine kinase